MKEANDEKDELDKKYKAEIAEKDKLLAAKDKEIADLKKMKDQSEGNMKN